MPVLVPQFRTRNWHRHTPRFCAFIKQWPTLAQVKRARRATLEKFFHADKLYRKDVIERRIKSIQSAMPLTTDDAIITPYRLQALVQIDHLEVVFASLARYDAEVAVLAPQHPDYQLFSCLPGAGPQLAPRLLVAFGEQRERFANAAELQKYSGVAPVTERSGQKSWVHWRWQCPTFLRQTLVEWANADHQQILLGRPVVLPATRQGLLLPGGRTFPRVQVDTDPVPMLDDPNPLQ